MAEYPYSIKFIFNYLEFVGFMSLYEFKKKWQNQCMRVYCFIFHVLMIIGLISHLLSTTTRSKRYLPEFLERLMEDLTFILVYIECYIFKFMLTSFQEIMSFMSKHFSAVEKNVVFACHNKAIVYFRLFAVIVTITLSGSIIETYFPITEEETERLRYIYDRSRPERRLQTNFWIPFLDDSASYTYEFMFTIEFYLIFLIIVLITVSCTVPSMLINHLVGQYDILCKYVKMLGHTHRGPDGDTIYYTNFETNTFITMKDIKEARKVSVYDSTDPMTSVEFTTEALLFLNKNTNNKFTVEKRDYDLQYCRQLIRFHQKLIQFQTMLQKFYNPIMFVKVVFNNVILALVLYQLTSNSFNTMSKARVFKVTLEFLCMLIEYYYLCHCSEELDECHNRVNIAITESHWFQCSPNTRRDLCMLIRRIQRPNHLKFYDGAIILSRAYYLSVVKLAYSFVNYMRV